MLPKASGLDDVLRSSAIVNPVRTEEGAYTQPMADTNDRVDVPPPDDVPPEDDGDEDDGDDDPE